MLRYFLKRLPLGSLQNARQSSSTCGIGRVNRGGKYARTYPTLLVNPDGSTYTIRFREPRQILRLPLNFEELAPVEQLKVIALRKPKKEVKKALDELDGDTFSARKYLRNFQA